MAYVKKVWKDAPDTSTPINAANLNHMEDGIAEADVNAQNALDRLDDVDDEITKINSDLTSSFDCGVGAFGGTITFNHAFAHPPAVIITPTNDNPALVWSVTIVSITTSGCTYVVKYSANGVNWIEFNTTINYIAMVPLGS